MLYINLPFGGHYMSNIEQIIFLKKWLPKMMILLKILKAENEKQNPREHLRHVPDGY